MRDGDPYRYPDVADRRTAGWVEAGGEAFRGYWDASEARVLAWVRAELVRRLGGRRGALLDAGAGEGRLVPIFADLFARAVLVEPDPLRLEAAGRRCAELAPGLQVELRPRRVEELEPSEERFDAIVCNHVLQHVATDRVGPLLSALGARLAPGGLLALATAQHGSEEDAFDETREDGSAAAIPRARFDELAASACAATLPTHAFARPSLWAALAAAGLRVSASRLYHLNRRTFERLGGQAESDERANEQVGLREHLVADLLVLAERA